MQVQVSLASYRCFSIVSDEGAVRCLASALELASLVIAMPIFAGIERGALT
jgi:hypothetical protein